MIRVELTKQVRRLRTWLAFAALAGLPTIFTIATRLEKNHNGGGEGGPQDAIFRMATAGGLNIAIAALAFMSPFFLVIVVSMFAGDSVAGEANWGTLRSLLVRPVPRPKLLRSKLVVVVLLAVAATVAVPLTGLVVGTIAFGWHDLARPFFGAIPAAEALGRVALATAYVAWGYAAIVAFAFLLSTLTDAPAGAIGGAIGLAVASQILDAITALRDVRYGLPTHYWTSWTSLFIPGFDTSQMWRGLLLQVPYVVVFGGLAFWWFRRKDILS